MRPVWAQHAGVAPVTPHGLAWAHATHSGAPAREQPLDVIRMQARVVKGAFAEIASCPLHLLVVISQQKHERGRAVRVERHRRRQPGRAGERIVGQDLQAAGQLLVRSASVATVPSFAPL